MKTLFLFTLILQFAYLIFAKSNSLNGDRILVILDKLEEKKNYSIFFKSLEGIIKYININIFFFL